MSIKLQLPNPDMRPRLTVIGVGGAGCNAVNNMIASGLTGVEFVVANTDAQALASSAATNRIQLGAALTEGLGAGSKPEVGEAAAEEAIEELKAHIAGSHMLFLAAGMGGGTGTGAAAVVARVARELGVLTVAIVTKPFLFEGQRRQRIAEIGIAELSQYVDTMIVIPNQNLFRVANDRTTFAEAFILADQVLYSGVACIVDLIIKEGVINLDFADVRTVLSGMGTAMMGTGEAAGPKRAIEAATEAISNPLLDDISLRGARGLLLSISGGRDLTLYEVDEAASLVRAEVDSDANIIVGATFDEALGDRVRVSIVASGMMREPQSGVAKGPSHSNVGSYGNAGPHGSGKPGQGSNTSQKAGSAQPSLQSPTSPPTSAAPPMRPAASPAQSDVPREMPRLDTGSRAPDPFWPSEQPPSAPAETAAPWPFNDRAEAGWPPAAPAPHSTPAHSGDADVEARLRNAWQWQEAPEPSSGSGPPPLNARQHHDHDRHDGPPPLAARSEHEPHLAGNGWQGPSSVTIEEVTPLPTAHGGHRGGDHRGNGDPSMSGAQASNRVPVDDHGFKPEPGLDVRRGAGRRIPEIDEFPQVAQREYRGRTEDTQAQRRPNMFERLTGIRRRGDDSPPDQSHADGSGGNSKQDMSGMGRDQRPGAPGRASGPPSGGHNQAIDAAQLSKRDRR
jgi:cell division protein FtsZ